MIRRQFIKLATFTGATGLASLGALDALDKNSTRADLVSPHTKTVTWRVRGYTCVTCAVGLETMLRQQKGVQSAEASYQNAAVTIQFHSEVVSEASLRAFITDLGFTAEEEKG
jgi:copper chaperone CopZ